MNKIAASLLLSLISINAFAQIDPEKIELEIDSLFFLVKKEFKPIIGLKSYEEDDQTYYHSTYTPTGGSDSKISIDSENSRSYYVYFELSTQKLTQDELLKIAQAIEHVGAKYGLTRKEGTDIKYQQFKAIRVEFNSDNIDVLGKYPSFTIGILKNSNTIELILNEPLWK